MLFYLRSQGSSLWWCHWNWSLKYERNETHSYWENIILGKDTAGSEPWHRSLLRRHKEGQQGGWDSVGIAGRRRWDQIPEGSIGGFWAEEGWSDGLFLLSIQFRDFLASAELAAITTSNFRIFYHQQEPSYSWAQTFWLCMEKARSGQTRSSQARGLRDRWGEAGQTLRSQGRASSQAVVSGEKWQPTVAGPCGQVILVREE